MGWKAIKEAANIKHIVQIREGDVFVGSAYIPDCIRIDSEGKIKKGYYAERGWSSNEDLLAYMVVLEQLEKSGELKFLFHSVDKFDRPMEIFTHKRGRVVKKYCEKPEWPNVTTDGEMIYENTFFLTRAQAKGDLLHDTKLGVRSGRRIFKERFSDAFERMGIGIKYLSRSIKEYLMARLIP